ncbi:MAG: ABC transporter permease, partial [Acidobacteriota bacterium]
MPSYLARRLVYAILTFLGITIATFALVHLVPGDPVSFYVGKAGRHTVPPAMIQAIRHEHHLDLPLPAQYLWWLRGIVTLDFGTSFLDGRAVIERIGEKLPNTLQLNAIAFLLAAAVGLPLGLWGAASNRRRLERASAVGFFLLYSLPTFWVALLLQEYLSVRHQVFPLMGRMSDEYLDLSVMARVADRARHLILPVLTLAYGQMAIFARFSKSAMSEVIRQDFITTARAKGATGGAILWHHAFRNALLPLITLLGLTIPALISGSVIVERIFQWDGIGLLYYDAILARDYPTILALTVATAVLTLLASILGDVLYA